MIPGFANLNYYEILDINMGIDAKEVQEAYYLVREAFSKNSLASYSLYTQEEREEIGKLIEEAYHILFDDQSRREYDKNLADNRIRVEKAKKTPAQAQAALPFDENELKALAAEPPAEPPPEPVVEPLAGPDDSQGDLPFIEEAPKPATVPDPAVTPAIGSGAPAPEPDDDEAEIGEGSEPLLLTDEAIHDPAPAVEDTSEEPVVTSPGPPMVDVPAAEAPEDEPAADEAHADTPAEAAKTTPAPSPAETTQPTIITNPIMNALQAGGQRDPEITTGPRRALLDHLRDGITGPTLKRVREQRGINLDQVFEVTRIRRPILQSIEDEEFDKLPAAVFLRGMVANYARYLGLPDPEAVAKSYMERMTAALGG